MNERLQSLLRDNWLSLTIWAIVLGVAAFFVIKHWTRIRQFLIDVREELKKCTWPTWQELRESTIVVGVSVFMLGLFVAFADVFFSNAFKGILFACGLRQEWLFGLHR